MAADEVVVLQTQHSIRRPVTGDEVEGWLEAASQRDAPRMPDKLKLREWLFRRDARKYRQLQRLMRWAEGEYERQFGMLPEDVRWILP